MHDIFISYSHKDAHIADAICHKFEEAGIRCWYAPRNIKPGDEWADAIIKALEQCKAMVLVFTEASNLSTQVRREVDSAVSFGKTIIPFKCTNTEPTGSMRYYLSTLHWMDALTAPMDASIEHLLKFTKGVLEIEKDVDGEEEEDSSSDETGREPGGSGSSEQVGREIRNLVSTAKNWFGSLPLPV